MCLWVFQPLVNGVRIVSQDLRTDGGLVHGIEGLLKLRQHRCDQVSTVKQWVGISIVFSSLNCFKTETTSKEYQSVRISICMIKRAYIDITGIFILSI